MNPWLPLAYLALAIVGFWGTYWLTHPDWRDERQKARQLRAQRPKKAKVEVIAPPKPKKVHSQRKYGTDWEPLKCNWCGKTASSIYPDAGPLCSFCVISLAKPIESRSLYREASPAQMVALTPTPVPAWRGIPLSDPERIVARMAMEIQKSNPELDCSPGTEGHEAITEMIEGVYKECAPWVANSATSKYRP